MQADRWQRVQALFDGAVEQPEDRRAAWLDGACEDEPELKAEVLSLLGADTLDRVGRIVRDAARATLDDEPAANDDSMLGRVVGAYRIVREIGRGGMGVVYLAERADGEFEQRVAFKVVRERLAHRDLIHRFVAERRILARLEHANIARLLDGGTTEEGLPYVVMEYVEGQPVDRYCERRGLPVAQRLELFLGICDAVHYAHCNLIVHRDLKPSNVLVTEDGTPKLLDFGVARLLDPGDSDEASDEATRTVSRALTPMYASPEQLRGEPISTASDVYSLGVVLYELLTGRRPYRATGSSCQELERVICELDPDRPSTAITREMARAGETHPVTDRELAGDLDNIVMMAMRKEPERRYASAAELAQDIRRHLSGHPVAARPDTLSYRLSRFVIRNRALSAALAAIVVLLVLGAVTATGLAVRADAAWRQAERQAAISRAVSDFLNVDVLSQADPYVETDREITLREVVDRASARIGDGFEHEPLVEAGVRLTLAGTYENLGDFDAAEQHYRAAERLMSENLGEADEETLRCRNGLAGVLYQKGEYESAGSILIDVRRLERDSLPEDHPVALTTLDNLAEVYDAQGNIDEAIATSRQAVAAHRRALGPDDSATLTAISNLALMYEDQDRFDESGPLLVGVLEARRRTLGNENPDTLLSMASLGFHFILTGDMERAEPLLREAVETGTNVLGPDHHWQMNHEGLLADLYRRTGQHAESEALYSAVLERQREQFRMDNPLTLRSLLGLASIYASTGRVGEAESAYAEVIERRRRAHGELHPATMSALRSFAAALRDAGRCDRVIDRLSRPVGEARAASPEPSRHFGALLVDFGRCLADSGRTEDARPVLAEGKEILAVTLGEDHEETRRATQALEAAGP